MLSRIKELVLERVGWGTVVMMGTCVVCFHKKVVAIRFYVYVLIQRNCKLLRRVLTNVPLVVQGSNCCCLEKDKTTCRNFGSSGTTRSRILISSSLRLLLSLVWALPWAWVQGKKLKHRTDCIWQTRSTYCVRIYARTFRSSPKVCAFIKKASPSLVRSLVVLTQLSASEVKRTCHSLIYPQAAPLTTTSCKNKTKRKIRIVRRTLSFTDDG